MDGTTQQGLYACQSKPHNPRHFVNLVKKLKSLLEESRQNHLIASLSSFTFYMLANWNPTNMAFTKFTFPSALSFCSSILLPLSRKGFCIIIIFLSAQINMNLLYAWQLLSFCLPLSRKGLHHNHLIFSSD